MTIHVYIWPREKSLSPPKQKEQYCHRNSKDTRYTKWYLEVLFEGCNGILRFAELLQTRGESLDGAVLVLALGSEKNIVQLQKLKKRLGSGVDVPGDVEEKNMSSLTYTSKKTELPSRRRSNEQLASIEFPRWPCLLSVFWVSLYCTRCRQL